jgi:hypothetical protein
LHIASQKRKKCKAATGLSLEQLNALAGCKSFLINQIRSRMKNREQIVENFQLSAGLYNYKLKLLLN